MPCREPPLRVGSAGFAVRLVLAAVRAELLHLQAVRVVTPVLPGDVVPVLAHLAGQRDLRTDIGGGHSGMPFAEDVRERPATITDDVQARRLKLVAEAGLEPATQRL